MTIRTSALAALMTCVAATPACAQTSYTSDGDAGLAYSIEYVERDASNLPKLQSFATATGPSGKWIVVGGRGQGLHGFSSKPDAGNFSDFSHVLYVVDPGSATSTGLSVATLPAHLRDALGVTNPQQFYDATTDTLYVVGGYGVDSQAPGGPHKTTFGTLTAFDVSDMIAAVEARDLARVESLIRQTSDPRLAVTGGGLERIGSRFMLVFGQFFDGEFVFDATELPYTQVYTEAVRIFTIDEDTLDIELYGEVRAREERHPFHRRDLNVTADIDPADGSERIAVFGGVFRPGALLGYSEPVLIDDTNSASVVSFDQLSNHYECAIVPVYSETGGWIARDFFGGIESVVLTPEEAGRHNPAGPSDGLPWINTTSRVVHAPGADRSWSEYDLGELPNGRYLGADAHFLPSAAARADGVLDERGIVHLDAIAPGARVLVGHVYGGIESGGPQQGKTGTEATNALFDVWLTKTPTSGARAR